MKAEVMHGRCSIQSQIKQVLRQLTLQIVIATMIDQVRASEDIGYISCMREDHRVDIRTYLSYAEVSCL